MDLLDYCKIAFGLIGVGIGLGMGIALGFEIATIFTGKGRFFAFTYARISRVEERP